MKTNANIDKHDENSQRGAAVQEDTEKTMKFRQGMGGGGGGGGGGGKNEGEEFPLACERK